MIANLLASEVAALSTLAMNPVSGFEEPLVTDTPIPFRDLCERIYGRITQFLETQDVPDRVRSLQEQTKISLNVIDRALEQYRSVEVGSGDCSNAHRCCSLPELSLAYNGGKDCLVLLILYLYTLHKRRLTNSSKPSSSIETAVQCVYIQDAHPFPEVEAFVATSIATYSLSLREYAKPMKAAFADYLRDSPSVKAILVGTRRTDPHGEHLTHFDPTDSGWPEFVRVHPVIDWHYVEIWMVCLI